MVPWGHLFLYLQGDLLHPVVLGDLVGQQLHLDLDHPVGSSDKHCDVKKNQHKS